MQQLERTIGMGGAAPALSGLTSSLANLEAFTGLAMSVSAKPTGIAADIHVSVDPSKLTGDVRQSLRSSPHQNAALSWFPEGSYGFFTMTNLGAGVRRELEMASTQSPDVRRNLRNLGVLDPGGVLSVLSGDGGLVVGPEDGSGAMPGFGFLAATSNDAAMLRFLDKASAKVAAAARNGKKGTGATWHREAYRGTSIATLSSPTLSAQGIAPSYAVRDGMALITSTPQELRRLVDTHLGAPAVTGSANYQAATAEAPAPSGNMGYVDIESIIAGLQDRLGPGFDAPGGPGPNLRPIKAFILSGSSTPTEASAHMFLLIR